MVANARRVRTGWRAGVRSAALAVVCVGCQGGGAVAIGPAGGLVASDDDTLTIVIWPGALGSYMDFEIRPSTMPPDSFGSAYFVRPNVELGVDAEIIYRGELPSKLSSAKIGAIHAADYATGKADWKAIPSEPGAVDEQEGTVRGHDDELAVYYTLLGEEADTVADTGEDTDPSDTDPSATGSESDPTGPPLSYAADVQPLWDAHCLGTGCHEGATPAQSLDLTGDSYANVVGVPSTEASPNLVEPGDPDASYLVLKIEGDGSILGNRMPSVGEPLTEDELALVRNWVAQGAPP